MKPYRKFLDRKRVVAKAVGFEVDQLNPKLFDYQKDIVKLALKLGRYCVWADCGLGKGFIALEWAHQIYKRTGKDVLILAPLAVSQQFAREAEKLGVAAHICKDNADVLPGINITNYERLHHFQCDRFVAVALDEASILKAFDGKFRNLIIDTFAQTPYKLALSATPAPNDHMELGNQCEFLGVMTRTEMLAMFFTHDGGQTNQWRLKGHAESEFWKFVCSWAVMLRKPSDLGYSDEGFELPELQMHDRVVQTDIAPPEGMLFFTEARSLTDQRHVRKQSLEERCRLAAELVNCSSEQWLVWCDLNDESGLLSKLIPDAVEIKGSDSPEHKESSMQRFQDGEIRCIVTKPSIAGFGLNLQNCHNMAFVGLSNSYEQFYQAVRRCWRFGQQENVNCYVIYDALEGAVIQNIQRKEADSQRMAQEMVKHMKTINTAMLHRTQRISTEYQASQPMIIPHWLIAS